MPGQLCMVMLFRVANLWCKVLECQNAIHRISHCFHFITVEIYVCGSKVSMYGCEVVNGDM